MVSARYDCVGNHRRGVTAKDHAEARGRLDPGSWGLMQFAITSIRDCTGINLELLGQKDINQYPRGSAQASRYDGA